MPKGRTLSPTKGLSKDIWAFLSNLRGEVGSYEPAGRRDDDLLD
jgi:hypothetical protein